jgi:transposase
MASQNRMMTLIAFLRRSIARSMPRLPSWTRRRPTGQAPFRALIALLCTIPGVSALAAATILAEIGREVSRVATAGHLLAWAGLCARVRTRAPLVKPVG